MRRTCRGGRSNEDRNSPASQFFSSSYSFFLYGFVVWLISVFQFTFVPLPPNFLEPPPGCCESFEMLLLSCSEWWRPQLLWPQQTLRCCCCAYRRCATAGCGRYNSTEHTLAQHSSYAQYKIISKLHMHSYCCDHNKLLVVVVASTAPVPQLLWYNSTHTHNAIYIQVQYQITTKLHNIFYDHKILPVVEVAPWCHGPDDTTQHTHTQYHSYTSATSNHNKTAHLLLWPSCWCSAAVPQLLFFFSAHTHAQLDLGDKVKDYHWQFIYKKYFFFFYNIQKIHGPQNSLESVANISICNLLSS